MRATAVVICMLLAFVVVESHCRGKSPKPCRGLISELAVLKDALEEDLKKCEKAKNDNDFASYTNLADIGKIMDFMEKNDGTCGEANFVSDLTNAVDLIENLTTCRNTVNACGPRFGGACFFTEAQCRAQPATPVPEGFCSDQTKTCCIFT